MHEKSGENFWKKTGRQFTGKGMLLFACVFVLLGVTGCKRKAQPQGNPGQGFGEATQTPFGAGKGEKPVSQDYPKGGCDYMMTDRGQYYVGDDGILRYYDFASRRSLPLCNKPECRHDGNVFCVASSKKYTYTSFCLYSGKIYITGIEETDTQYLFKLLAVALDGSELDEVATYLTLEKTGGLQVGYFLDDRNLFIHRNKAFLPFHAEGEDGFDDTAYYGTAVYDLDTKELRYLDAESIAKENKPVQNLQGVGNFVFYYTKDRKKATLYRYDITTNTVEPCKLMAGFQGVYLAVDEDTVAHCGSYKNKVYLYRHSTGENELVQEVTGAQYAVMRRDEAESKNMEIPKEQEGQKWVRFEAGLHSKDIREIHTDGEYFYICEARTMVWNHGEPELEVIFDDEWLHVYDKNFSEVAVVNMRPIFQPVIDAHPDVEVIGGCEGMLPQGGEIYFHLLFGGSDGGAYVGKVKRGDLLAGTPVLEEVCEQGK